MLAASLQALLEQSIDYAGMFPPCSLALEPALQNQAEYVHSPEAWMLNTFVLSVDEFEAAAAKVALFDWKHALNISALGVKSGNNEEFIEALRIAADKIKSFGEQHAGVVSINQLEMPLPTRAGLNPDVALGSLAKIGPIIGALNLQVFWEAPVNSAKQILAFLAELAEQDSPAKARPFGYKLRTGGVTADAFPTSRQIADVLVSAVQARVPIKFTAGLHHPLRQFRNEVETKMHGFLNVLGAGVLTAEHGWDEQLTATMLEDENPASFSFGDDSFAWREWQITVDHIKEQRDLVTSFGSCSFDEPREDLRALNWL